MCLACFFRLKRDPCAYRVKYMAHPRSGDAWYVYIHLLLSSINPIMLVIRFSNVFSFSTYIHTGVFIRHMTSRIALWIVWKISRIRCAHWNLMVRQSSAVTISLF